MKNIEITTEKLNRMDEKSLRELAIFQQEVINDLQQKTDELIDQVALLRAGKFGRKSEQKKENPNQITILNYIEKTVDDEQEAIKEPVMEEVLIASHTRKKRRKGQREEDLSGLATEIIEHTLPEEIIIEKLGSDYERFDDAVSKKLSYVPAKLVVEEHHIAVYRSKTDGTFLRADYPRCLMKNSVVTPSLASAVIQAKYVNHQPLNRIEEAFKHSGCVIRRQVMANWMIKLTELYLSLVYDRLKTHLLSKPCIHADETPVTVRKDGRKAGAKSYMWVYSSLDSEDEKTILYDYQKTRASEHPARFLESFKGVIVSDGYQVYHKVAGDRADEIKVAGCWVHALRKFKDSVKACGDSDKKKPKFMLASEGVGRIQTIIHEDNALKVLPSKERLKKRQTLIKPLVEAFFAWVNAHISDVTRGSNTGKAFTYALNQKPYLMTFLDYADVPHENNTAERAIRPFTLGRKNWQIIDTISGAKSSAILYSLAETAKANRLHPYEYFKYLLEEIPLHMDEHNMDFIDELLPWSKSLPESCLHKKE